MKKQKNSRPAGTGATENAKPEWISRRHYTTNTAKKQVFFACAVVMVALIIVGFIFPGEKTELIPVEHKVARGETLWTISKDYKPDEMTMDEYMSFIYKHNKSALIYPGDTVIVGVYEND